jgi:hypothetical protein
MNTPQMGDWKGVGDGFLLVNSMIILTDAFPPTERGMALELSVDNP